MIFATASRERQGPTISLAGMIDVMFLLLVFFMTASVFREQERQIDVSLPQASEAEAVGEGTQIVISVKGDGTIYMAGSAYTLDRLRSKLSELAEQFPNEAVVIRGDRTCPWGRIVQVMDTVHAADLQYIQVSTTKLQSEL